MQNPKQERGRLWDSQAVYNTKHREKSADLKRKQEKPLKE